MALSKRFASITVPRDDDNSNDELLQRLLKKPTNFDQIEPSNLGFSSHRDVPGTGDSDDDEDLDEDWADDFKSLLKSCGSQKEVSSEETDKVKQSTVSEEANKNGDSTNDSFIKRDTSPAFSSPELTGGHAKEDNISSEKKSPPVIEDRVVSSISASVKGRAKSITESQDDLKNKETKVCSSDTKKKFESIEKKYEKSDNKTSPVPSKLKTEKRNKEKELHVIDEKVKGSKICDSKIKRQVVEKAKGGEINHIKVNPNTIETEEKKNDCDADSVLKAEPNQRADKRKERHTDRKSETKHAMKPEGTSHGKAQIKLSESNEKRKDKPIAVKHKVTKDQSDTSGKTTQNELTEHEEELKEQKNREAAVFDKKEIHSKSKTIDPETKKSRPYVIKEATSFPLDDLLPAAAPIKKPRASLDSHISSTRQSPCSARKRHKSEMISSHQIGAKKQKVDVQSRFRIDEAEFDRNESGNMSYIPPDVASLLAAVDTNQSLLTFFRQQLHNETGSRMLGGNLYDDPVTKPAGFYTERNETENRALVNTDIDNNKSSEELFHLLVQQCSELVKTEEDRSKLQSLVDLLKLESGSEFAGTGFTPELEVDSYKSPPPPSPSKHSPPSPYSPKSKLSAPETFEGRTLLKGGVEPRHIPKNFLTKCGKSRPLDPRTYSTTDESLVLPFPKFAEEFWKKEKVRQLRKKNLAIKDDLKKKHDKTAKGHHQVHKGHNLDPRLAKLEHEAKTSSVECHPEHKLDENQNLLTDEKVETSITGVSAFKAIHDPGFYAAVASVFSGDDEMIQPKDKIKLKSEIDIDAGSKMLSPHTIPVLINGGKSIEHDLEDVKNPVIAGHTCNAVTPSLDEPVHLNNLVRIETNINIHPSISNVSSKLGIQTGPCIGIVKPMQVHNDSKPDLGHSDDARQMNMELSSDTEEGEINDIHVTGHKALDRHGSDGFSKHKRKNGQTHEKEKRIFDRLRQKDEDGRNTDDDRSSCSSASSASSRGRHHRRSWRGGHYDYNTERNKRSRSRYSSCSSVESRNSDKQHSDRKRYHSQREGLFPHRDDSRHSYRPYYDERQFQRGNRGRYDNKAKFLERKPYYGKSSYPVKPGYDQRHDSGKSGYDHRHVERYSRERSNSGSYESRKIVVNDKREMKSGNQRQEPPFDSSNIKRHSIEITDSEDEKLSMDYRQKFGNKSSPHENADSRSAVSQSIPLPESYNADKEFLNYSLKKMEMADKVKHDYRNAAGVIPVDSQDKQEKNLQRTETFLKNRKETVHATADTSREKIAKQTKSVPKPISFKVKQTKSVHDRISAKSQVPVKQTPSVHDRIGVKPQVSVKQAKSVHHRIGVKPQISVNRPQAAADGAGVFKYSDMISLADLEESESFTFKKKK